MTDEEKELQRQSFAKGNAAIDSAPDSRKTVLIPPSKTDSPPNGEGAVLGRARELAGQAKLIRDEMRRNDPQGTDFSIPRILVLLSKCHEMIDVLSFPSPTPEPPATSTDGDFTPPAYEPSVNHAEPAAGQPSSEYIERLNKSVECVLSEPAAESVGEAEIVPSWTDSQDIEYVRQWCFRYAESSTRASAKLMEKCAELSSLRDQAAKDGGRVRELREYLIILLKGNNVGVWELEKAVDELDRLFPAAGPVEGKA